jgi:hypothetical protein
LGSRKEDEMAKDKQAKQQVERSLTTDIATVATPVAVMAAPVVGAWAHQHFGQSEKPKADPPPSPPQQPKDD